MQANPLSTSFKAPLCPPVQPDQGNGASRSNGGVILRHATARDCVSERATQKLRPWPACPSARSGCTCVRQSASNLLARLSSSKIGRANADEQQSCRRRGTAYEGSLRRLGCGLALAIQCSGNPPLAALSLWDPGGRALLTRLKANIDAVKEIMHQIRKSIGVINA